MNYSFHPNAEVELEEAENHYDGIDETLGDRFRAEFEMSTWLKRIQRLGKKARDHNK